MDLEFYRGKRVLVTGHTGFKGAWLTAILACAGAQTLGYALPPEDPSLFRLAGLETALTHVVGDVRDAARLREVFSSFAPELVFHLAAQPLVREGYRNPLYTFETNVMGTANVLEAIRHTPSVRSAVIVTTDKVYRNNEQARGYREDDVLDGFDPYSSSKACAELVTASCRRSFPGLPPISTARAGNVLGGGDFAKDRILPDCVRAAARGEHILVRNPGSVRPYQHVLEPLFAYLLIAERQYAEPLLAGSYNVGPADRDCLSTGELAALFCELWGEGAAWRTAADPNAPHEAGCLRLDCGKIRAALGWRPRWDIRQCMALTVRLEKLRLAGGGVRAELDRQIGEYLRP